MIENQSSHTIILTVDNATAQACKNDLFLLGKLHALVASLSMRLTDGTVTETGIYFKRIVMG